MDVRTLSKIPPNFFLDQSDRQRCKPFGTEEQSIFLQGLQQERRMGFIIGHVAEVASQHPFYSTSNTYPLPPKDVEALLARPPSLNCNSCLLSKLPVTSKENM